MLAGYLAGGVNNIFLGYGAGSYTAGNNNIFIGNGGKSEYNTIRIGDKTFQTKTYIAGIYNAQIDFSTGISVYVDQTASLAQPAPPAASRNRCATWATAAAL